MEIQRPHQEILRFWGPQVEEVGGRCFGVEGSSGVEDVLQVFKIYGCDACFLEPEQGFDFEL